MDKLEKRTRQVPHKALLDRFLRDKLFANLVMLCAGAFGNLVLAAFNGVLWLIEPSLWHEALAFYFVALMVMGSLVAACTGSEGKLQWRVVAVVCGVTLVVLAAIVVVIMYLCIVEGHNDALPEIAMIATAAFTFYDAGVSIVTATKTMRGDLRQQAMLRVSTAGTIGAMLMLEMQMLGTYAYLTDPQSIMVMEAVSGGVGALLLLLMGCSLIKKVRQRKDTGDSCVR